MAIFQKVDEPGYENVAKFYGLQEENKFDTKEKFDLETTLKRKMRSSWEHIGYVGNINKGSLFMVANAFKSAGGDEVYLFAADNFLAFGLAEIAHLGIGFKMYFDFIKQNHEKLEPHNKDGKLAGYVPQHRDPFTTFTIDGLVSKKGPLRGKLSRGIDWTNSEHVEARDYVNDMDVLRGMFCDLIFEGMDKLKDEPFYATPMAEYAIRKAS